MAKSLIDKHYSAKRNLSKLKNRRIFGDLCVMPKLKFESQEKSEVPILLVREHPLYLILSIFGSFMWLVVAIIFSITFSTALGATVSSSLLTRIKSFTILLGISVSITSAIYAFIKWYYNLFLITNHRIVDLDFTTLSKTSWTEAPLNRIEDAEVRNIGLLESMLDLGDVYVQTAGAKEKIEIRRVPKPMKIQDILLDLAEKRRKDG